jgi:hypothetical protein
MLSRINDIAARQCNRAPACVGCSVQALTLSMWFVQLISHALNLALPGNTDGDADAYSTIAAGAQALVYILEASEGQELLQILVGQGMHLLLLQHILALTVWTNSLLHRRHAQHACRLAELCQPGVQALLQSPSGESGGGSRGASTMTSGAGMAAVRLVEAQRHVLDACLAALVQARRCLYPAGLVRRLGLYSTSTERLFPPMLTACIESSFPSRSSRRSPARSLPSALPLRWSYSPAWLASLAGASMPCAA